LLRLAAGDHPNVPDGIHHYGHAGETTWFGLAQALFTGLGIDADLSPCTTADFPAKAKRPQYSVLDPVPLHEFIGEEPLHWTEALEMCMKHLKTN
jgi:dTDP-4-dehydrorhamnose reductase